MAWTGRCGQNTERNEVQSRFAFRATDSHGHPKSLAVQYSTPVAFHGPFPALIFTGTCHTTGPERPVNETERASASSSSLKSVLCRTTAVENSGESLWPRGLVGSDPKAQAASWTVTVTDAAQFATLTVSVSTRLNLVRTVIARLDPVFWSWFCSRFVSFLFVSCQFESRNGCLSGPSRGGVLYHIIRHLGALTQDRLASFLNPSPLIEAPLVLHRSSYIPARYSPLTSPPVRLASAVGTYGGSHRKDPRDQEDSHR